MTPSDLIHRLTLVARGLGFVFLVYFIPVVARDLLGAALPGGGFLGLLQGHPDGPVVPMLVSCATFALSVVAVLLYGRTWGGAVQPRPLVRFDLPWFRDWRRGVVIGVGATTLVLAPLFVAGVWRIDAVSTAWRAEPLWMLAVVATLVLEAAREELGFRGPAQRELTAAAGFPVAAIVLAGSFAIIHGGNPQIGRTGLLGVFLAGLALAGLARARGDLGMPCGVHAGWNVGSAIVWSVPVSGFRLPPALFDVSAAGSDLWTGGSFGVEGSLPGIAAFLILAFVTWSLPPRGAKVAPDVE
jgi:membrane protease YdiL (CAAX protease family)